MDESQDPFTLHCTEETDSDSSYYDCEEGTQNSDVEEGTPEIKSESAYVRNSEATSIQALVVSSSQVWSRVKSLPVIMGVLNIDG